MNNVFLAVFPRRNLSQRFGQQAVRGHLSRE
jgi:hypothetical protein